jgi:hypothetical protein
VRRVQVHYGECIANHSGPESCAAYREVCDEALTWERAGQPLSREIFLIQDADAFTFAEGKTNGCVTASARTVLRGRRPGMHGRSLFGNREISSLTTRKADFLPHVLSMKPMRRYSKQ